MTSAFCRYTLMIALALSGLGASAGPEPSVADLAERGDLPGVRALVETGTDINQAQPDGATALHWAAHRNDVALAKLLLAAGATPNAVNDYAITPAYLAALNGSAEMLDLLIEAGADPDAARPAGETVLMTAVRSGSTGKQGWQS